MSGEVRFSEGKGGRGLEKRRGFKQSHGSLCRYGAQDMLFAFEE